MFADVANQLPGTQALQFRKATAPVVVLALSLAAYVLLCVNVGEFVAIGALIVVALTRRRSAERLLPTWLDTDQLKIAAPSLILVWVRSANERIT